MEIILFTTEQILHHKPTSEMSTPRNVTSSGTRELSFLIWEIKGRASPCSHTIPIKYSQPPLCNHFAQHLLATFSMSLSHYFRFVISFIIGRQHSDETVLDKQSVHPNYLCLHRNTLICCSMSHSFIKKPSYLKTLLWFLLLLNWTFFEIIKIETNWNTVQDRTCSVYFNWKA